MRQTVKSLRETRERERVDFAQTKKDEAWRANCDALRTATSRQEHMLVEEVSVRTFALALLLQRF